MFTRGAFSAAPLLSRCGSMPTCSPISALPTSSAACRSRMPIRWSGWTAAPTCCAAWAGWWPRNRKYSAAATRRGRAACSTSCDAGRKWKAARPDDLAELLQQLGPIWPSRLTLGGIALGDCWRHPAMTTADATSGLVPLHKLSQWLAYSLIEPLQTSGIDSDRYRWPDRPCRISQWRAVRRYRRAVVSRSRCCAAGA